MTRAIQPYALNIALLLAALLLSVAFGAVNIPPGTVLNLAAKQFANQAATDVVVPRVETEAIYETILFQIRLPHALLMALTGAALAGSGAAYQGLFRNPLADPYLIGVASGAGLGAVLMLTLPGAGRSLLGMYSVPVAAFAGAGLAVFAVYSLARVGRSAPVTTLILAGVAVGAFASALTSFWMLRGTGELRRVLAWLMGGAALDGWQPVWVILPYIVVGLGVLAASGHALNVLQFGEEQARTLGLPVERTRLMLIAAASLATAAAVSFSGIIGFVGLVVPHIMRLLWGPDYRRLISLSILGGASMLLLADLLARWVLAPEELPVGIITSLTGAPFFLWILRRAKGTSEQP